MKVTEISQTAHRGGHITEDCGGIPLTVLFDDDLQPSSPFGTGTTYIIPCIIVQSRDISNGIEKNLHFFWAKAQPIMCS